MTRAILYTAFVLTVTLVGLEVLIRLSGRADHLFTEPAFEMAPGGAYWRYRPGFTGWVLGPTHVRIGALGARLHDDAAPAGDARIAVFGDSVTFGQAVEDGQTFSAQVQVALRQSRHAIDVLNFGVQGHTMEMANAHLADVLPQLQPHVVVLGFITDDLNPAREGNRVDRFGYLTNTAFGDASLGGDLLRAGLRRSRLALLTKDVWLRRQAAPMLDTAADVPAETLEPALQRVEAALARFQELTTGRGRIVLCLDLRQNALTRAIHARVRERFPKLAYFDASPNLDKLPLDTLRVLPDGHPNASAHQLFARILARPVLRELSMVLPGYLERDALSAIPSFRPPFRHPREGGDPAVTTTAGHFPGTRITRDRALSQAATGSPPARG
jgi:lysophospholipase L1-like esterase